MSLKCFFGHNFSTWLIDEKREVQERHCKTCNFLERSLIITETPCDGVHHNWTSWYKEVYDSDTRRRDCRNCHWLERKDP